MRRLKKIAVNVGLVISLTVFAGLHYAQAEGIKLPLPVDDPEIQSVISNIMVEVGPNGSVVKEMMRQTRDSIKEQQAKILPLMPVFRNTIGNAVSTQVMAATRTATMNAQMTAMQDPVSPIGVPMMLAPKFE